MVDFIKEVKKDMGLKDMDQLVPPTMPYKDWKEMFEYNLRTQEEYRETKDAAYFRALVAATDRCIKEKGGKAAKVSFVVHDYIYIVHP